MALHNINQTALFFAVRRNNYDMVELLIKSGADINISEPIYETNDYDIFKLLLDSGADIDYDKALNYFSGTNSSNDMLKLILKGNPSNENMRTQLYWLALKNKTEMIDTLITLADSSQQAFMNHLSLCNHVPPIPE